MNKSWQVAQREFEQRYFTNILILACGNIVQAAKLGGVARSEVYDRIKKFGIDTHALKESNGEVDTKKEFTAEIPVVERAIYAKYAKYAEFSHYSEFSEFANFADQERHPSRFLQMAMNEMSEKENMGQANE